MKRALLTTAGTVAGLVSVLAYSPPRATQSLAAGDAGAGLSGPAPATAGDPSTAAPDNAASGAAAGGRPIASPAAGRPPARAARTSATPRPSVRHTSAAKSTAATSAAPRPSTSAPRSSSSARPAPKTSSTSSKPTASKPPAPAGPQDFTGSAITYQYGTLQVAIRVQGGKITDAWAVTYPKGSSLPYSEMAIPILRSQTLSAQSAKIAGATGATLTSTSWKTSLASALAKAGL